MITGMSDSKLPPFPFPRDSKAPLDTPPAYSEGPGPARARTRAPREPSNAPPVQPQAAASNPFSQPTSSASTSRAAPQHFTHAAPPAPPPAAPMPPSPSPSAPGPHAYPRPADAASYQSSSSSSSKTKTKTKTKGGSSPGATVARAVGQGVFALVAMPVVATAAALYGSGKLVEGIGRGLSAGPGAVLRAYRRMDGRIKGDASGGGTARGEKGEEEEEEEEERWRRYQHQHQQQYRQQQQQQRYPYGYGQGEGGVGLGGARGEGLEGVKPKLGERSLQMPMKGSLMEDPSVGMAGGSGSMRAKN